MTKKEFWEFIQENEALFVDLKVVDFYGGWKHVTLPIESITDSLLDNGVGFDASNFGYAVVEKSDMVMIPDLDTIMMDGFGEYPTASMICNVYEALSGERFNQDPRGILEKVVDKVREEGIADEILFGPEYEFHVLDEVANEVKPNSIMLRLDSVEGFWNSGEAGEYCIGQKRGYHRTAPFDKFFVLRNEIVNELISLGIEVKYHHHEVGTAQLEIETNFMDARKAADATLLVKYIIRNVALEHGYLVTFLPKPIYNEAGNGMHVHQFMRKEGKNVFAGDKVYNLSELALNYTAGILKHSAALLGFSNPTTNSYRRLVPGFEAPTNAVFALSNRTSAVRIPGYVKDDAKRRIEFRTIDATCNPYLAFAAMILAGVDGIMNKIDPTAEGYGPFEGDLSKSIQHPLPKTLEEAAIALREDHEFLKRWDIFPEEMIEKWVSKKIEEHRTVSAVTHPIEYQMYFDL
ncbi:MAG TPA: type I glutamate--ammonia ligase [Thermotogota bacterium]|nr:type I glutamate--ammonia ligase [Thermotogota bacterium]HPJ89431.1 type I glutamate--ammonia ligase [Thermotogota bacterium]HPR95256.1 type I glutamate--ammonia ligase [Thermotogota bacterium]